MKIGTIDKFQKIEKELKKIISKLNSVKDENKALKIRVNELAKFKASGSKKILLVKTKLGGVMPLIKKATKLSKENKSYTMCRGGKLIMCVVSKPKKRVRFPEAVPLV